MGRNRFDTSFRVQLQGMQVYKCPFAQSVWHLGGEDREAEQLAFVHLVLSVLDLIKLLRFK